MNILVIGGGGYLGVPLSNKLSTQHSVTVYDDFRYNSQKYFNKNISLIHDSIKNILRYKNNLKTYDLIYYLACPRLNEITEESYETSLDEFKQALNLVSRFDRRFIYISSCSVYGNVGGTVNESSETQITSLYSKLKIACESELLTKTKYNHLIVRLSTLYGNSFIKRNDVFINNLVEEIVRNKYIEIYDPAAIRPHLNVLDAVDILFKLASSRDIVSGVVNVGNGESNISKLDLINLLKTMNLDFEVKLNYTNDSRSYNVNFDYLNRFIHHNYIDLKTGIMELL